MTTKKISQELICPEVNFLSLWVPTFSLNGTYSIRGAICWNEHTTHTLSIWNEHLCNHILEFLPKIQVWYRILAPKVDPRARQKVHFHHSTGLNLNTQKYRMLVFLHLLSEYSFHLANCTCHDNRHWWKNSIVS